MKLRMIFLSMISVCGIQASAMSGKFERVLDTFEKVVVSPHINVVLEQGVKETVTFEFDNIDDRDILYEVKGQTLHVYLRSARVIDKNKRAKNGISESTYKDAHVTAFITYRTLKSLEVRGQQEVTCVSPLRGNRFKLKSFGETQIHVNSINVSYLKAKCFGRNHLRILSGQVDYQKLKLYGENHIDVSAIHCYSSIATSFGHNRIKLHSQDELKISSFGEIQLAYAGEPSVSKGIILGSRKIRPID